MRITPFDEYPFHQHPTPFGTVATSDSHFNDGYFLAFYAADHYFFAAVRLHPNVNVIDGGASVAHAGRQRAVRASRALRPRYEDIAVGPIRLDIVEPMRCIRLHLDHDHFGFDVELETIGRPIVEDRYQHLKYGAVVNDTIRYTTVCRATGIAHLDGRSIDVERWHAMRDHSWGIRSSMGVPTRISGIDRTDAEADRRAFRLWVPFEADDHSGFFNTHEDADGTPLDFEGRIDFPAGGSLDLAAVEHDLTYVPGTTRVTGGDLVLVGADGSRRQYRLEASGTPADVHALGYYRGWHDGLGPGIYRGAEVTERDDYEVPPGPDPTGPPHVPVHHRFGATEHPMFLRSDAGEGMAHLEHTIFGPYHRYGFA
jgi:hypothetical protein